MGVISLSEMFLNNIVTALLLHVLFSYFLILCDLSRLCFSLIALYSQIIERKPVTSAISPKLIKFSS